MTSIKEYMQQAIRQAEAARDEGEIPVGAVITKGGKIIARAHNKTIALKDATAHAEMLAIRQACSIEGDFRLIDCTLYVTLEPCSMCAGAIANARLKRLVFGAFNESAGACQSRLMLLSGLCGQNVQFVGGVLEEECAEILKDFFKRRRPEVRS